MNEKILVNPLMKVVLEFNTEILKPRNLDFLLTGSLALQEHGLPFVQPHDVDIEVICTPEQEEVFRVLALSNKNEFFKQKTQDNYEDRQAEYRMKTGVTWTHKPYIFTYKGILINVWCVSAFSHDFMYNENGIKIAKLHSILDKKLAYHRSKDYQFVHNFTKYLGKFVE